MDATTHVGPRELPVCKNIEEGHIAMKEARYHVAVQLYTEALKFEPGRAVLYSYRCLANLYRKLYPWVLKDAETILLMDRSIPDGFRFKGAALHGMRHFDLAIATFREGYAFLFLLYLYVFHFGVNFLLLYAHRAARVPSKCDVGGSASARLSCQCLICSC